MNGALCVSVKYSLDLSKSSHIFRQIYINIYLQFDSVTLVDMVRVILSIFKIISP